ncbi:MAG TPA: Smr/MutS family protein [Desulfobacterales bacterium]|jgi:dsDNA-specific endonuclease/ATPase MutS2|nr:Smr/MutS family protein [Desulfobacterales bacterium]
MNAVRIPIEDVIDLHTFRPEDIADLIEDYIDECIRAGLTAVRIIHGKGTGRQKARVQELLRRHPQVLSFTDAPPEAGGWGATIVELEKTLHHRDEFDNVRTE